MSHPHAPAEPAPGDGAFLRTFGLTLGIAMLLVTLLTWRVDPLGVFGTGWLPPVVAADRDQKAALVLSRRPAPALVVLGSSRSKTLDPACIARLTGMPAFNFAVNGADAADLLAITRFLRQRSGNAVRAIWVGVEPELLQPAPAARRALAGSRALARYAPGPAARARASLLAADLLGWQAVSATARSLWRAATAPAVVPETALDPDGRQRYPAAEAALATGAFPQQERVTGSMPGVLSRYAEFPGLDSDRVAVVRSFLREAGEAGIAVVAFIPPVHPALARAAESTDWRARTEETVRLLRDLEGAGQLRYVETRALAVPADSAWFVDAIHFLAPAADRLAETIAGHQGGCALQ